MPTRLRLTACSTYNFSHFSTLLCKVKAIHFTQQPWWNQHGCKWMRQPLCYLISLSSFPKLRWVLSQLDCSCPETLPSACSCRVTLTNTGLLSFSFLLGLGHRVTGLLSIGCSIVPEVIHKPTRCSGSKCRASALSKDVRDL